MTDYDQFLLSLEEKISKNRDNRSEIIKEAFSNTICPYLKEKLRQLNEDKSAAPKK